MRLTTLSQPVARNGRRYRHPLVGVGLIALFLMGFSKKPNENKIKKCEIATKSLIKQMKEWEIAKIVYENQTDIGIPTFKVTEIDGTYMTLRYLEPNQLNYVVVSEDKDPIAQVNSIKRRYPKGLLERITFTSDRPKGAVTIFSPAVPHAVEWRRHFQAMSLCQGASPQ